MRVEDNYRMLYNLEFQVYNLFTMSYAHMMPVYCDNHGDKTRLYVASIPVVCGDDSVVCCDDWAVCFEGLRDWEIYRR